MAKKDYNEEKDLFGRTLKTAHATGTCISCKGPARKKDFVDSKIISAEDAWKEYKLDGLCQKCCEECYSIVRK